MLAYFYRNSTSTLFRYGFALFIVLLTTLVSSWLPHALKDNHLLLFMGAVAISAWVGGFIPGLLVTVLSLVITKYVLVDTSAQPLLSAQAELLQLLIFAFVAILISALNEARLISEQNLRTSNDQLRIIFENVADAITVHNDSGLRVFANDAAAHLLGFKSAKALTEVPASVANSVYSLYGEDGSLIPVEQFPSRLTLKHGLAQDLTARIRLKETGETNWVTLRSRPVFNTDGKVLMAINIMHDVTEIKRSEGELVHQRERFEAILNSIGDAVMVADAEGQIEYMNPAAENLINIPINQAIGQPFDAILRIVDQLGKPPATSLLKTQAGQPHKVTRFRDHLLYITETERIPVDVISTPLRDPTDTIVGGVFVIRDIRERYAIEQERERNAVFLRSTLNSLAVFVGVMTPDSILVEANERLLEVADLTPDDVLGKPFAEAYWWSYDPQVQQQLRDAIQRAARGEAVRYDGQMRIAEGQLITVDFTISPLFNDEGKVTHLIPSGIDISHRKQTEIEMANLTRAIEIQRQRLNNIVANVPGIVWEAYGAPDSVTQNMDFVSDYATTMLGYPTSKWRATPNFWLSIVHEDDQEQAAKTSRDIFDNHEEGRLQYRSIAVDGTIVPVETLAAVIHDKQGVPVGMRGVTMDITERKKAEQALQDYARELSRSNEELNQFAYVASHDLQEPLRAVTSYLQLLENRYHDQLDQDAKDFIDFAVDGANRMKTLINDLLTYARVESRARPFEVTDFQKVLDSVQRNLQAIIEENDATITSDPMPEIVADRMQIMQLFQNLISNAIKFQQEGIRPVVHISARQERTAWRFAVSDNGIGIDAKYQQRIFTVFQRLHTRTQYEGTGIGLAVCRKVVERHGGKLWVESTPNEGSTFYFTIPLNPQDKRQGHGNQTR